MDADLHAQNTIENREGTPGMERTIAAKVKYRGCDEEVVLACREIRCRVSYEMVKRKTCRCIRDAFVKDISAKRITIVRQIVAGNVIRPDLSDSRIVMVCRDTVEIRTTVSQ